MKVALLLSGQPRFVTGPALATIRKYILERYDTDVFCHFWFDPAGGTFNTAPWSGLGDMPVPPDAEADIITSYHPKRIRWDAPLKWGDITRTYDRVCHPSNNLNLTSMYLSMKRSYELMQGYMLETGVDYDWIIRLRYDAILTGFPDLGSLAPRLYSPDYSQYHSMIGNNGLIMSPVVARIVMRIYDLRDLVYDKTGCLYNDENMVTALVAMFVIPYTALPRAEFYIELDRKGWSS